VSIETGLLTYLKTDTDLMALVGNGDSPLTCRIYPVRLPQNWTAPAITYQRISGPRLQSLSGPSGRAHPRYQFDILDGTYASVRVAADKLRAALDGYTGAMGSETVGACTIDNDFDGYLADTDVYRVSMDFIIWHIET